jgi:hypothetical protein
MVLDAGSCESARETGGDQATPQEAALVETVMIADHDRLRGPSACGETELPANAAERIRDMP